MISLLTPLACSQRPLLVAHLHPARSGDHPSRQGVPDHFQFQPQPSVLKVRRAFCISNHSLSAVFNPSIVLMHRDANDGRFAMEDCGADGGVYFYSQSSGAL